MHIDTLKLSRKLVAACMEPAAAEAIAETLADVDTTELATKADIVCLQSDMRDLENRLVIKTGGMIVGTLAILTALMRLIPPG